MKDITIQSGLKTVSGPNLSEKKASTDGAKSFTEVLEDSIEKVNKLQNDADQAVQELMVSKTKDIHNTMIALEKADVSFQMRMKVRGKILEAYEEVMRMQV